VSIAFHTARRLPTNVDAIGVPVTTSGPVPRVLRISRAGLADHGFEAKAGQVLVLPAAGARSTLVAVGLGDATEVSATTLRTAAAAFARAVAKRSTAATALTEAAGVPAAEAARAVAEGIALGTYRFTRFKGEQPDGGLTDVTLVGPNPAALATGAQRGAAAAQAVCLARDLANTPPHHLNALDFAEQARTVATGRGLSVEVFEREQIEVLRLGGLLGVNRGSDQPPAVVKVTYTPPRPAGTVCLVGKGVMYDSGGISLKPSDGMHVMMKMDMTGAAVVLAVLSVLPILKPRVKVVGFCLCTDNMPSGRALKLGDVLTIRNGKTVEIHNTDAEGRLLLADGLVLATEEQPDAIVDIATLTGAVLAALGKKLAGVMGNSDAWVDQLLASSRRTDEKLWHLPLPPEYRKLLDSNVADMKNIGGPYGGALTAGIFLQEFVDGVPWVHLDIAGVMDSDADEGWLSKGATGFGVRLLLDALAHFEPPAANGRG
jgi:leucyl aminopeptidase